MAERGLGWQLKETRHPRLTVIYKVLLILIHYEFSPHYQHQVVIQKILDISLQQGFLFRGFCREVYHQQAMTTERVLK